MGLGGSGVMTESVIGLQPLLFIADGVRRVLGRAARFSMSVYPDAGGVGGRTQTYFYNHSAVCQVTRQGCAVTFGCTVCKIVVLREEKE